jgi:uncharacterized protein YndB with AHSA1/START domain
MNRATYTPSSLADARCHPDAGRWTLVFVRHFRHPPQRVWAALTDAEQLREWAPFAAGRDLDAPGDVTLTMISGDDTEDLQATVTRVEPPRRLEYTWGEDLLRWDLAPEEPGTRLTLHHTVADRDWAPKAAAGWHLCLDVAEHLLDGQPIGPIRGEAAMDHGWQHLHDMYYEELLS